MTSIQTKRFQRHSFRQNIPVDQKSEPALTQPEDNQDKNNRLQIDVAIIKFVIGSVIFDTIFFLVF